jgi:flagellar hook assembly protein FlgD
VTLTVIDALGRSITTLAEGEFPAGAHTVTWNGRDRRGLPVASGLYFYTLSGSSHQVTRKMMLLK